MTIGWYKTMEWLILIVIIVVVLVVIASADSSKSERQMEEMIETNKQKIIEYCDENIKRLESEIRENIRTKTPILFHTKDSAIKILVDRKFSKESVKLLEKHLKTVLINDKYSKQAKAELKSSWSSFVITFGSFVRDMAYSVETPSFDNTQESKDDFTAKLEAFGFDSVKEEQALKESIEKDYRKEFGK